MYSVCSNMSRRIFNQGAIEISKAKRYSLLLSKEIMEFFRECHKEIGARSIGASVQEKVLTLKKQLEERNEAPLVHPFTGTPLSKDECAYIQRIQGEKGFQTVREAFAYFEGRLEGRIEKRLGAKALEDEDPQLQTIPQTYPCPFYSLKGIWVHCKKDEITKNGIHRISQKVCDQCWTNIQSKKQQAQEPSENYAATINIETP
jgi:hypothetical protein